MSDISSETTHFSVLAQYSQPLRSHDQVLPTQLVLISDDLVELVQADFDNLRKT